MASNVEDPSEAVPAQVPAGGHGSSDGAGGPRSTHQTEPLQMLLAVRDPLARLEKAWKRHCAVVAIALQVALPDQLVLQSRWLLPSLELALLVALVAANPVRINREPRALRAASLTLTGVLSLAVRRLARHRRPRDRPRRQHPHMTPGILPVAPASSPRHGVVLHPGVDL